MCFVITVGRLPGKGSQWLCWALISMISLAIAQTHHYHNKKETMASASLSEHRSFRIKLCPTKGGKVWVLSSQSLDSQGFANDRDFQRHHYEYLNNLRN